MRGETTVAAGAEVGSLGCEAYADTFLTVAHAPVIDTLAHALCGMAPLLARRRDWAIAKLAEVSTQQATSHTLAELQTELRFEIDAANPQARRPARVCDALRGWSNAQTKAELIVRREVFPGAKVVFGPWALEVAQRIVGPLKFFVGEGSELMVTDLPVGHIFSERHIARGQPAATAPNLDEMRRCCGATAKPRKSRTSGVRSAR